MLKRNIDIFDEFFFCRHKVDEFIGDLFGAAVENTNPFYGLDRSNAFNKLTEVGVGGRILRDEVDFDCAVCRKSFGFGNNVNERSGHKFAADGRDNAVSAMV